MGLAAWIDCRTPSQAGLPSAWLDFVPRVPATRVVRKYRFDIWQNQELLDALADWDIDGLVIGGVELQRCVLYAMLGADERGFEYVVPEDLVSGINRYESTAKREFVSTFGSCIRRRNPPTCCWPVGGSLRPRIDDRAVNAVGV